MIAVITIDGVMLGLYTSQADAWKVAKPIGAHINVNVEVRTE